MRFLAWAEASRREMREVASMVAGREGTGQGRGQQAFYWTYGVNIRLEIVAEYTTSLTSESPEFGKNKIISRAKVFSGLLKQEIRPRHWAFTGLRRSSKGATFAPENTISVLAAGYVKLDRVDPLHANFTPLLNPPLCPTTITTKNTSTEMSTKMTQRQLQIQPQRQP